MRVCHDSTVANWYSVRLIAPLLVLAVGWLLLQHHPDALSYEQCLRFLKLWADFQVSTCMLVLFQGSS